MTVAEHHDLVRRITRSQLRSRPDLVEDGVQEGLITVWKVLTKWPEAPVEYIARAVRYRVIGVAISRPSTGSERKSGTVDSYKHIGGDVDDPLFQHPACEDKDPLAGEDVRAAVLALSDEQRSLVFDRFWLDMEWQEIAKARGLNVTTVERRWRKHIRPALLEALA